MTSGVVRASYKGNEIFRIQSDILFYRCNV